MQRKSSQTTDSCTPPLRRYLRTDLTTMEGIARDLSDKVREDDRIFEAVSGGPNMAPAARADCQADRFGRSESTKVVLFLPRPVTEEDLLTDRIRRARSLRRHKASSRRRRWLKENVGTLVFVFALFALTWFVTAK
jgi:hypothetical protein